MGVVTIRCATCDCRIGSTTNSFVQIGKGFISPVVPPDAHNLRIVATGQLRDGDDGTLVGGCQLQDAECAECHASLGQRCIKAPVNHVLSQDQVIFRTGSITLRLTETGRRAVEPKIQRVLKVKTKAKLSDHVDSSEHHAPPRLGESHLLHLQADISAQREDINRISATGYQIVSSFEANMARVDTRMNELDSSIDSIRKDGERSREDIAQVRSEARDVEVKFRDSIIPRQEAMVTNQVGAAIEEFKSENASLRQETSKLRSQVQALEKVNTRLTREINEIKAAAKGSVAATKEYTTEVSNLRRELQQLHGQLATREKESPTPNNPSMTSNEMDILTSHISKVGDRASRVEPLEMNFELLKRRVERIEAREKPTSTNFSGRGGQFSGAPSDETVGPSIIVKGSQPHDEYLPTSPKRRRKLVTSDYSCVGTIGSVDDAIWEPSSPTSAPPPSSRRAKPNNTAKRSSRISRGGI